jgi:hypothetical protein
MIGKSKQMTHWLKKHQIPLNADQETLKALHVETALSSFVSSN